MRRLFHPGLLPFVLLLAVLPFPGTVALRLVCIAAAFAYAIYVWKRSAVPPFPLKLLLVVWVLVALASLGYAVDPAYTLSEIKNEMLYTMMIFVAFFVVAVDDRRMKVMLLALAGGVVVLCVWALVARFTLGYWNESGRFGGTGAFAGYLVAVLPLIVLLGLYFEDVKLRTISLGLLGLLLVTGFLCAQRIIWPVLLLQSVVALLLYRKALGLGLLRVAGILALLVSVVSLALVLSHTNRLTSDSPPAEMASDERLAFLPMVVGRIMEQPFAGAGFGRRAMSKAHGDLIPKENTLLWHAHNLVLNYGLGMGIPGMLAILLVFGGLIREYACFWRSDDRRLRMLGVCGIVLVLGVLSRNMVNDMFLRDQALLFWALNGILLGVGCRQRLKREAPQAG